MLALTGVICWFMLDIPDGDVISLNLGTFGMLSVNAITCRIKSEIRESSLLEGKLLSKRVLSIRSLALGINFLLIYPLIIVSLSFPIYS